MKNLLILFTGITFIAGMLLSLLANTWIMLPISFLLMGSAFFINHLIMLPIDTNTKEISADKKRASLTNSTHYIVGNVYL